MGWKFRNQKEEEKDKNEGGALPQKKEEKEKYRRRICGGFRFEIQSPEGGRNEEHACSPVQLSKWAMVWA